MCPTIMSLALGWSNHFSWLCAYKIHVSYNYKFGPIIMSLTLGANHFSWPCAYKIHVSYNYEFDLRVA